MKIEIKNLCKQFRKNMVLKDINMELTNGHIYGLNGRNGSGKSVFLKVVCGLYKPTTGEVLFDGKSYNKNNLYVPNMRALIEKPNFFPELTGYENLELLEFIYKTSDMGASTTTDLLNTIKEKDNKIKKEAEDIIKTYEKYLKESEKLLKKSKTKGEDENMFTKAMSTMGIKKEIKNDNSDAHLADMLIQGLTMGNLEINKRIENYKNDADRNTISLAKNFVKDFEDHIETLKEYL